jgi:hypothetical protein
MYGRIVLLLMFIAFTACVEPFDPEIDSYEDILVVDGIITDEEVAARVRLSRSYPYDENRSNAETNAIVIISDDAGILIINTYSNNLSDLEPGMVFLRRDIAFPEPRTKYVIKKQPESKNALFNPSVVGWISAARCKKDVKTSFSFIAPDENGQYEIYIEAFEPGSRTFGANTFYFQVSD